MRKQHGGSGAVREIAIPPLHQRDKCWQQVCSFFGQVISLPDPLPFVLIGLTHQQSVCGEQRQAVTQNRARNVQVSLEVVEAAHAVQSLAEDEKCPLLAE
jgi:hypothetical protein